MNAPNSLQARIHLLVSPNYKNAKFLLFLCLKKRLHLCACTVKLKHLPQCLDGHCENDLVVSVQSMDNDGTYGDGHVDDLGRLV